MPGRRVDNLINDLQERAKELNCLYKIEELLNNADAELSELFAGVIEIIPAGWQFPEICQVKIEYEDQVYISTGFRETPWIQSADIAAQE
jgi:nitrate/nitrite-specific signal transduction histidine kinase